MKPFTRKSLAAALIAAGMSQTSHAADSIGEALKESSASGSLNLRYEDVDNSAITSDGLTLRSRLGFASGSYESFSVSASFEDVRDVLGIDDRGGLIPDPEVTELDTAFVQYQSGILEAKVGRQVIALDNQRHIGHVGWRQDRQTFDAIRTRFTPSDDTSIDISYLYKYNRIFAETADHDASSILLNASHNTAIGKLVGYAYLLDNETIGSESDTYGLRLTGSKDTFTYTAEYASQSAGSFDADYYLLEAGMKISAITAKLGYEVLGSDNGAYGFSTPLATGHAFNGWADVYLGSGPDGLKDMYLAISGKIGAANLSAIYHDFESDTGSVDKGDELNLVATMPLAEGVVGGIKYAAYSQGDAGTTPDRDKLWLWLSYNF